MVLNDVWRTIGNDVGFFYESNFEDVPASPGLYAWFYPLRVLSRSPQALMQFLAEVQALLNYDSIICGPPKAEAQLPVVWWNWSIIAGRTPKALELTEYLSRAWDEIASNEEYFADFQRTLLKASILMPPLYVGKADNLNTRCGQHLRGTDSGNDFHRRFEEFARHLNLPLRTVQKLVFACVRTGPPIDEAKKNGATRVHEVVEALMKCICAPPYGMR